MTSFHITRIKMNHFKIEIFSTSTPLMKNSRKYKYLRSNTFTINGGNFFSFFQKLSESRPVLWINTPALEH